MALDISEARGWSIERMKFEIETRRQDVQDLQRELSDLRLEYAEDPDSWHGSYPGGLDFLPRDISKLQNEIESLRELMRSKL